MAHTNSAKKRIRQDEKRRLRNRAYRTQYRRLLKRSRELLAGGETAASPESAEAVARATRMLDHVATKGVIHRRKAARLKSRLMRRLNATQAAAPSAEG